MSRGQTGHAGDREAGDLDAGQPDSGDPDHGVPDHGDGNDPVGRAEQKNTSVDPRWVGIIEVLVRGLDGVVRWESDSVVLGLPDCRPTGRGGDLDGLGLCLERIGVPVVLEASPGTVPDSTLVEFISRLVESGVIVTVRRPSSHAA